MIGDAPPVTARYQLRELIGAGGMGAVYRAYDRLTGQMVALKRVSVAPEQLAALPADDAAHALLALAHEFRTLAALRHPHIISVLDYGFDAARQPFFTMELLGAAQPLLPAGRALPLDRQADLLLQALEALAYLHRRGILHHDLKPSNMLIAGENVRLLDFGLAVDAGQARADDAFGTLQYLAPEVLDRQPYTAAADLYSLGVVAYELLVGAHPFPSETLDEFLDQVLGAAPDLTPLGDRPALAEVIGRLLAKRPADRPASAHAAIATLRQALGRPSAPDPAIRESYLQAAAFVGRAGELGQLRAALSQAIAGAGGLWLVGGESGIGKSRLLDELRAEALVAGALAVVGQAAEGGGAPYQIWREPLRHLALEVAPGDLAASVLKALVPDIASLIGRPVADAPDLPGEAGQMRLHLAVADLLRRIRRPLLIVLEDLQWAGAGLALLRDLRRLLPGAPLLIVGSYRADEWPAPPEELAGAHQIRLERLPAAAVAELSAAMLGPAGQREAVVTLLQRESEGNAFFLVEVVRALAEEAGGLAEIGAVTLPTHVFAGGMQQLLLRRLGRMPGWAQPLLRLAALAGRQIDQAVLERLAGPEVRPAAWLQAGADAAVLTAADGGWRFAHDKLREAVRAELAADKLPALHRQVALAIEAAYPAEPERRAFAEALLEHWRQAGDTARALDYIVILASWQIDYTAEYDRAAELLGLGEQLAAQLPAQAQLQITLLLGQAEQARKHNAEARPYFTRARDLARALGDARGEATALCGLANITTWAGDLAGGERDARAALDLAEQAGDQRQQAACLRLLGVIAQWQGQIDAARALFEQALDAAAGNQRDWADIRCDLAQLIADQGDVAAALEGFEQVLAISEQIGDVAGRAFALMNVSMAHAYLGQPEPARAGYARCVALCRSIGNLSTLTFALIGLGQLAERAGDLTAALEHYQQSWATASEMGSQSFMLEALNYLTVALARAGQLAEARAALASLFEQLDGMDIQEFQIEGVAAGASVAWAAGHQLAAAELAGLVAATAGASDAQLSVEWLGQALAGSLAPDDLAAAGARGAARGLPATLGALRAWVGQPPGTPPALTG